MQPKLYYMILIMLPNITFSAITEENRLSVEEIQITDQLKT